MSATLISAVILAGLLAVMAYFAWRVIDQANRERAAWKRVGSCKPVGDTAEVRCTDVHLSTLRLPSAIAACGVYGNCDVQVNREAKPAFSKAIDEVVRRGLGKYVTRFETVNRRRCRSASTGRWIGGCVSKHSHGIAVDFRPFADNGRWKSLTRSQPGVSTVVTIFRDHGFRWGGTFKSNYDPQHLEWLPR